MSTDNANGSFEVLSPWAEADAKPQRGLSATRLADLAGKKIGLLCNTKRAARPITSAVEAELKERFPTAEISRYFTQFAIGPEEAATENKDKFDDWVKGIDAVIAAVGD